MLCDFGVCVGALKGEGVVRKILYLLLPPAGAQGGDDALGSRASLPGRGAHISLIHFFVVYKLFVIKLIVAEECS